MMERHCFSARRFVFVLLLLLGFVALVSGAAASELPLLPPVDVAQSAGRVRLETASAPTSQVELLMIRLIRTFFGDQVKWSPFRRSDPLLHTHHHRIVREHRPHHHPNLHEELAKRRFRLRGKPVSTTPNSQARKPQQ